MMRRMRKKSKPVLYHNPRCGKSREALALLEERGLDFDVVRYLETPLSAVEVKALLAKLGGKPAAALRTKEPPYEALGLSDASTADEVARAVEANPILLERPILVVGKKAVIGRPPELVLSILP